MTTEPSKKAAREIQLQDPMAEAGRKLFARQIKAMIRHEKGSRSGEDIESVHQMRVAIRRMRTLYGLIGSHYRAKTAAKHGRNLRRIARALGRIRDLDVLILDLQDFQNGQPEHTHIPMDELIAILDARRRRFRSRLNGLFDSKSYARFLRQFSRFCRKRGRGAKRIAHGETPHQVRHVLPLLLHERLASVRAYDAVLPAKEDTTLHNLRVEFKQLRYALEFFSSLLGSSAGDYLVEVKAMQDLLGRINDIAIFAEYLCNLEDLTPEQAAALDSYTQDRERELEGLRVDFYEKWQAFNARARLRQFSDALLVLR